jgi:arylsulfatase A-like enzyme
MMAALAAIPLVAADRPNIIFILADDLGYGEIGSYGQKLIATPHLDRMAKEGMKFTQFYAGSSVCAPSRSVLMTGQHTGHTRVRGNAARERPDAQTLQAGDGTIAQMLRDAGYATGLIGKWGLGAETSAGEPRQQGFGYYFGFINQTHAHNHYPDFLWRNGERVRLPNDLVQVGEIKGTGYATKREAYANDLFFTDAEEFVTRHRQEPFFLYLAITTPHANNERSRALGDGNEVPDEEYKAYADKPWNTAQKGHAAMISRMDRQIGSLLAKLQELGLDENTLVLFSSDNGAHREGGPDYAPEFFQASGPLRGIKRDLYEGGIRVPLLARWPGRVPAGAVSDHAAYFGDVMATLAELAKVKPPAQRDSLSFVPAMTGKPGQEAHDYLYWEHYERGVSQAVLIGGRWKVIQQRIPAASIQLFDLQNDLGEQNDVAAKHPEIVARAQQLFASARVDNEHWQLDRVMPAPNP